MSNNRRKYTKDPIRINNYNKFLTTLDNSNLNPPRKETKFEEIRRNMPDEDSIQTEIDKIIENINNNFNLNNISSSNFTGQNSNDIASSYLEPNDPNLYVNYLNKNLNIKIYNAVKPKQCPTPNIKEEEPNVVIRETVDIDVEINTIIDQLKNEDIKSVEKSSKKIRSIIHNLEIPKDIAKEIIKEFKKLDAKYVAVRSSATAEDSVDASWAGELESYLNITEKDLLTKVKKCWSSLFTPRAIFYRFENKLHTTKISVAVVVQKMIQSKVSGITFTVHPVTEDKNQMIIEAGWGLGEAIVSGMITPDAYVINKKDFSIIDINIADQAKQIIKTQKGNEFVEVDINKRGEQKLSSIQIVKLAKICANIEKYYNFPCDIEWAWEKEKFYIVQSRPITTLN